MDFYNRLVGGHPRRSRFHPWTEEPQREGETFGNLLRNEDLLSFGVDTNPRGNTNYDRLIRNGHGKSFREGSN